MGVHHVRARKTGPCFPLAVARCRAHEATFTVYPPGHVPYGRAAVVPVDAAGRQVRGAQGAPSWEGTMWGAALDAAAAERWPTDGGLHERRRTQGRRLERGAKLLGIAPATPRRMREQIATALSVPLLKLNEAADSYRRATRSWVVRACAVVQMLTLVERPAGLLVSGFVTGLWGRPSRWDPGGLVLRPLV